MSSSLLETEEHITILCRPVKQTMCTESLLLSSLLHTQSPLPLLLGIYYYSCVYTYITTHHCHLVHNIISALYYEKVDTIICKYTFAVAWCTSNPRQQVYIHVVLSCVPLQRPLSEHQQYITRCN